MELIIRGGAGKIQASYQKTLFAVSPVVLVLPDAPEKNAHMNDKLSYTSYCSFVEEGFHAIRMNYRGVGRSNGEFTNSELELADAGSVLDWIQKNHDLTKHIWIAGIGYGAYLGMQLLMRRPEITSFIAINTPVKNYDFSFLSPCPCSGLLLSSDTDLHEYNQMRKQLAEKINEQKDVKIKNLILKNSNPQFNGNLPALHKALREYIATQKDKENKLI